MNRVQATLLGMLGFDTVATVPASQWIIFVDSFVNLPLQKVRLLRTLEFNTVATVPSFPWMWQSAILKNNFCKSPSLFCCSKSTLLDAPALLALLKKWLDCAQHTAILPDWILKIELALIFHSSTAREPLAKLFFEILWEILEISIRMKPDTLWIKSINDTFTALQIKSFDTQKIKITCKC